MKKIVLTIGVLLVVVFTLWKCSTTPQHARAAFVKLNTLPTNELQSCTLSADTFKSWFTNKTVTAGGVVSPANSVTFPHNNNCDFYQWSERMFLWLASPDKGETVLASPTFYDVTPLDDSGHRSLIQNVINAPLKMTSRLLKVGPDGLPVVRDVKGRLFEISPDPTPTPSVKDSTGKTVEVAKVKQGEKGRFLFLDKAGNNIAKPKAILSQTGKKLLLVQKFGIVNNKHLFLTASGEVVQSEEGQATGDVLMSQGGSLVYYYTEVNDVYAYYLTMRKIMHGVSNFPTTAAERDAICAFARHYDKNKQLLDSNALAIEVKTSWVEANTLADTTGAGYVTTMADIQQYDTTSHIKWTPRGHKIAKMAMVGIHIVGSVAGHPEMIWATFEHTNNTPNAAYDYVDNTNHVKHVPQDTGTGWLFTKNAADDTPIKSHMHANVINADKHEYGNAIIADSTFTISPANTLRLQPWGTTAGSLSNAEDTTSARSNSEILSINNAILSKLAPGDVRGNYLLIGATWTDSGTAPNRISYGRPDMPGGPPDTLKGVAIGTNVLANSTMETYMQTAATSCFFCHSNPAANKLPPSLSPDVLSHVFSQIQPLIFKATQKAKK